MNNAEVLKDITEMLDKIYGKLSALEELIKGQSVQSEAEPTPKEETTGSIFLKAIKDSLNNGGYYVRKRYTRTNDKEKLLGVIDGNKICIRNNTAYQIYSAAVTAPISKVVLWRLLESEKAIYNRSEMGLQRYFGKKREMVIYIDANKIL